MINEYINFVEEWCEVLESKAFARQHGKWSKEQPTTFFHFKINKKYTKIIQTCLLYTSPSPRDQA